MSAQMQEPVATVFGAPSSSREPVAPAGLGMRASPAPTGHARTTDPAEPAESAKPTESKVTGIAAVAAVLATNMPALVRNVALGLIASISVVFALQWGQRFFIPLVFSVIVAYTLNPLVVWLERIRVPRAFGAAIVLISLLSGGGLVAYSLSGQFQAILVSLPDAGHQISKAIQASDTGQPSTIEQMQAAATEIETATTGQARPRAGAARQTVAAPAAARFNLHEWLWAGSLGALEMIGQATMVVFLVFFLLLSGDSFKRKLVKMTPLLSSKKITVRILDDINSAIQSYMFMLLVTNVLLSLMLWVVFHWVGLENAGAWAVAAGWLHIIPYFGSLIVAAATGLTAFIQFESVSKGVLVAGASLAVATIVGTVITTWMTGRIARMNPAAVFIGLLFWGWLWGFWGLLLGAPIIVMLRVFSDHLQMMEPVASLLGE